MGIFFPCGIITPVEPRRVRVARRGKKEAADIRVIKLRHIRFYNHIAVEIEDLFVIGKEIREKKPVPGLHLQMKMDEKRIEGRKIGGNIYEAKGDIIFSLYHFKKEILALLRDIAFKDDNIIIPLRGDVREERCQKDRKQGDKCLVRRKGNSDIVSVKGLFQLYPV